MRVKVRLFAGLRERAGWGERELEAESIGDVWPQLGLGEEPAGLLYAVNQEYADRSTALAEGDEVAIIPPVSGGAFRLGGQRHSTWPPWSRRSRTSAPARSRPSREPCAGSRAAAR